MELTNTIQTQICRTCLQETSLFNSFEISNDEKSSQIKIEILLCIPEIDMNLLSKPVLCMPCLAALDASYRFKKQCLYTEERIRSYLSVNNMASGMKIADVYNSCNSMSLSWKNKDIPVLDTTKKYIDDLNTLLDDALGDIEMTPVFTNSSIHVKTEEIGSPQVPTNDPVETSPVRSVRNSSRETSSTTDTSKDSANSKLLNSKTKELKFPKRRRVHRQETFNCTHCDFKTLHRRSLKIHETRLHKNATTKTTPKDGKNKTRKKSYSCFVCRHYFHDAKGLNVHLMNAHKEKTSKCRICNTKFNTDLDLKNHMSTHKSLQDVDKSKKCYTCQKCNYITNNPHSFSAHGHKHK